MLALFARWLEPRLAFFPSAGETGTPDDYGVRYQAETIATADGERLRISAAPGNASRRPRGVLPRQRRQPVGVGAGAGRSSRRGVTLSSRWTTAVRMQHGSAERARSVSRRRRSPVACGAHLAPAGADRVPGPIPGHSRGCLCRVEAAVRPSDPRVRISRRPFPAALVTASGAAVDLRELPLPYRRLPARRARAHSGRARGSRPRGPVCAGTKALRGDRRRETVPDRAGRRSQRCVAAEPGRVLVGDRCIHLDLMTSSWNSNDMAPSHRGAGIQLERWRLTARK